MTRWPLAAAFAAVLAGSALLAPAAGALDVDGLAERLREDPVLVDPRSTLRLDEEAVQEAVQRTPVPTYVVVLPQADVDSDESGIDGVLLRVVEALRDPRAVVVVVTDAGELQAGEGGSSGVDASGLLDRILQERSAQEFSGRAVSGALVEFARGVGQRGEEGAERGITGSGRRTVGLAGLVGVAVAACGLLWFRAQRRARRQAPLTDVEAGSGGW